MMKIAFITDSGCGQNMNEMASKKVFSLPLQISYDNQNFFDLEQIKMSEVITLLKQNKVLKTSLPSLGLIDELFSNLKNQGYEHLVVVPISSGLSGTMNAFYLKAQEYNIKITCVEIYTTYKLQEYLITYLAENIKTEDDIQNIMPKVNECIESTNTFIIPNDLSHLKRSGRLSLPAMALANLLKIKPILQLNKQTQGKIDQFDKVRTFRRAIERCIENISSKNIDENYIFYIAHVDNFGDAIYAKESLEKNFPKNQIEIIPLTNVVSAHCGLNSIAIQYFRKIN